MAERLDLAPPPGRVTIGRSAWHVRFGSVVVAWLAALVVLTLFHPFVPASGWLLVHLLVLGAVSNAILIWTWHFAAALLRLPDADARTGQVPRLVAFNAGALLVVGGVVGDRWPAVLAGGVVVGGTAVWHAGRVGGVQENPAIGSEGHSVRSRSREMYARSRTSLYVGVQFEP